MYKIIPSDQFNFYRTADIEYPKSRDTYYLGYRLKRCSFGRNYGIKEIIHGTEKIQMYILLHHKMVRLRYEWYPNGRGFFKNPFEIHKKYQ